MGRGNVNIYRYAGVEPFSSSHPYCLSLLVEPVAVAFELNPGFEQQHRFLFQLIGSFRAIKPCAVLSL